MADRPEEKEQPDPFFPLTPSEEPDRDVPDDEDDSGNGHKSLTEAEQEAPTDSDLKITLRRLFPRFANKYIDTVSQAVMVARIFPDTILDRIYLTVVAIVEKMEVDEEEIDVMEIINLVTTAFEIGLDAKGRIDAIELHGSARESELESEGIGSRLGGGLG